MEIQLKVQLSERRYNIDWLRIIAFFLVFIFIVHDFSNSFWNEFKEEKN